MAIGSPTIQDISTFAYGALDDDLNSVQGESIDDIEDAQTQVTGAGEHRRSMYVDLFEGKWLPFSWCFPVIPPSSADMITTVLENEYFLFDVSEIDCFDRYQKLSCTYSITL